MALNGLQIGFTNYLLTGMVLQVVLFKHPVFGHGRKTDGQSSVRKCSSVRFRGPCFSTLSERLSQEFP